MNRLQQRKHERRNACKYARLVIGCQMQLAIVVLLSSTDCRRVRRAGYAALHLDRRDARRFQTVLDLLVESGRFHMRPALEAGIGLEDSASLRDALTVAYDLANTAVERTTLKNKRGNTPVLPGITAWRQVPLQVRATE